MRGVALATAVATLTIGLAPASATEVPTVFVHKAQGSPDGTGSWAWLDGHAVPSVVRAEAPSAAASKISRLEWGDNVELTGRIGRTYRVVSFSTQSVYDATLVVEQSDSSLLYVQLVAVGS